MILVWNAANLPPNYTATARSVTISINIHYIIRGSSPVLIVAILIGVRHGLPQKLNVSDSMACYCH